MSCDNLDRTECDRCILNVLEPALMQQVSNGLGYNQIQQLLTLFRSVLNQEAVASVTVAGQVEFITPQAKGLLIQYFGCQESNTLPIGLHRWLKQQIVQRPYGGDGLCSSIPLHIELAEQQLLIYWILDAKTDRIFLLLEERELSAFSTTNLKLLGLTQREAEVLFWIARDKSNGEIAKVLDCCEGTVRKHLEHLYKKLEVQTRLGAVMTAMERLGLLRA